MATTEIFCFFSFYAVIASNDHLTDQLFIKYKVKVDFGNEYEKGTDYLIVFCKIRRTKEKLIADKFKNIRLFSGDKP